MSAAEAIASAQVARRTHGVPARAAVSSSEQRFIELPAASGQEVAARDLLVWVVRFAAGIAWIDLAVDDASGQIVRVERSRSGA